jgi:hypothetical protein
MTTLQNTFVCANIGALITMTPLYMYRNSLTAVMFLALTYLAKQLDERVVRYGIDDANLVRLHGSRWP